MQADIGALLGIGASVLLRCLMIPSSGGSFVMLARLCEYCCLSMPMYNAETQSCKDAEPQRGPAAKTQSNLLFRHQLQNSKRSAARGRARKNIRTVSCLSFIPFDDTCDRAASFATAQ